MKERGRIAFIEQKLNHKAALTFVVITGTIMVIICKHYQYTPKFNIHLISLLCWLQPNIAWLEDATISIFYNSKWSFRDSRSLMTKKDNFLTSCANSLPTNFLLNIPKIYYACWYRSFTTSPHFLFSAYSLSKWQAIKCPTKTKFKTNLNVRSSFKVRTHTHNLFWIMLHCVKSLTC